MRTVRIVSLSLVMASVVQARPNGLYLVGRDAVLLGGAVTPVVSGGGAIFIQPGGSDAGNTVEH